jgi:hypothetical protein
MSQAGIIPPGSHNMIHTRRIIRRDGTISQYTLWLPVAGREVNLHVRGLKYLPGAMPTVSLDFAAPSQEPV